MSDKLDRERSERPDAAERKKARGNDALFRTMNADEWARLQNILGKGGGDAGSDEGDDDENLSFDELPAEGLAKAIAASIAQNDPAASASGIHTSNEFSQEQLASVPTTVQTGGLLKNSYRLVKELSVGKLGTVYAAEHTRFGGRYVVKVLHRHLAQAPQQLQMVMRAIRGAERLNHPGIVRPFLLDQDDATQAIFYFMDFVPGTSLAAALANRTGQEEAPPFSDDTLLDFVAGLVAPLEYAHNRDAVCRNLHPAHILKTDDKTTPVRLLNFGFPIQIAHAGGQALSSEALNDLYYAAPELRTPGQPVTPATDIFSLGVLLYQMLTGILPVGVAQPPSRLFKAWPVAVDAVVGKATQANWEDRYQSAGAFLEALRGALTTHSPMTTGSHSTVAPASSINRFRSVVSPSVSSQPRMPRPSVEELPRVQSRSTRPSMEDLPHMPRPSRDGMPQVRRTRPPSREEARSVRTSSAPSQPKIPTTRHTSGATRRPPSHPSIPTTRQPARPQGRQPTPWDQRERPVGPPTSPPPGLHPPTSPPPGLHPPPSTPVPRQIPSIPITSWHAHEETITSLSLSPDGKFLATAGMDNTFKIWSAGAWSLLHSVKITAFHISHLAWSHNSRYIAFANDDDQIEVWDLQSQQRVHVFSPNARTLSIAWNPTGHHLYAATDDGEISIWHLALGRRSGQMAGNEQPVNALLYVPGQEWLLSGGEDLHLRLWQVAHKRLQKEICRASSPTHALALSPQSDRLVTGHSDGSLQVYAFPQGNPLATLLSHEGTIRCLSYAPNGAWIASASHDSSIKLWSATHHNLLGTISHHQGPVHSLGIHNTGRWMISASADTEICVWDVSTL